ncbi:MAG: hypothetical protein AAF191_16695, partial [Verrucomicrobiota bacterium]
MRKSIFWSPILVALLVAPLSLGQTEVDVQVDYLSARIAGLLKVHQSYEAELKRIQEERLAAQDLAGANVANQELKEIQRRIGELGDGEDPSIPGLLRLQENVGPDSKHKQMEEKPIYLRPSHSNFLDRLRRGISALNDQYYAQADRIQKAHMANARLEEANTMEAFKNKLRAETTSLRGLPALAIAERGDAQESVGDAILDEAFRKHWREERGQWKFEKNKLTGQGDSRIDFERKLRAPFTLSFDYKVVEGMRPRIYVGKVTIANMGYEQ